MHVSLYQAVIVQLGHSKLSLNFLTNFRVSCRCSPHRTGTLSIFYSWFLSTSKHFDHYCIRGATI